MPNLNRIKVVLVEKGKTGKWLAEQLGKSNCSVRKEDGGDYILDILEPHDPTRDDNVGKAKALARYASENPAIGRAQLIRMSEGVTGKTLKRLDFAASSELRENVLLISQNGELDSLFIQYGI